MAAVAVAGSILAYLVVIEGGLALWDKLIGDPEGDVQSALESIAIENQVTARAQIAAEARGTERIEEQFSRFNPLAVEALTSAGQARRPGALRGLRGGREVTAQGTELLDLVSSGLGMSPEELGQRSSPGRMGDFTGLKRAVGGAVPSG